MQRKYRKEQLPTILQSINAPASGLTYEETLQFLYQSLPMYTRIGKAAYKSDLNNTILLCNALGNPEHKFKSIHVAGTNGKGSVSNMLAAVLQSAGYSTGLYTSPHLKDFRERIRINGQMISKEYVINFVAEHKDLFDSIKPSFFEMNVALCFSYFAENQPDISIIETGLGGRLDSTNIIKPMVSCITNIGFDHMDLLGHSLQEIAIEKAGIIKPGVPVVIGEGEDETENIFIDKAHQEECEFVFANKQYQVELISQTPFNIWMNVYNNDEIFLHDLELDLGGNYQLKNAITTIAVIDKLRQQGVQISDNDIRQGFSQVRRLTGFSGRWHILQQNPLVIADTGHNSHGLKETMHQLANLKARQIHMVFGMVKDKDIGKVLELLPHNAKYYLCAPNMPRAIQAVDLLEEFMKASLKAIAFSSVSEALNAAKQIAAMEDIIFVGGSTFVVAEVI